MSEPKYEAGNIIDISFGRDKMPDRIYINMVYKRPRYTQWMYEVLSEKNDKVLYLSENDIFTTESKKTSKCYDNEMIKKMYEDGYRFCGNMKRETAFNRANNMKNATYIKHIILCDAVDKNGSTIDGKLGLWVMYNRVINNNGDIIKHDQYNMYQIK